MKKTFFALSVACLVPMQAFAGDDNFSATFGFVNDYAFRGVTQTDEGPAAQGSLDYAFDLGDGAGAYVGVWGSGIDFNDADEGILEMDWYGGVTYEMDKWAFDVGAIYYSYPGATSTLNYDFVEAKASVGYDFDVVSTSATLFYSPEYFGDSGDATYAQIAAVVPINDRVEIDGTYGYQWVENNTAFALPDYGTWSLGVSYNLLDNLSIGAHYVDTDLGNNDCADGCEERIIFSITTNI